MELHITDAEQARIHSMIRRPRKAVSNFIRRSFDCPI